MWVARLGFPFAALGCEERRMRNMREVKVKALTEEDFRPYGSYTSIADPTGFALGSFYADRVSFPVAGDVPVGISVLLSDKPEKMIVSQAEYHNKSCEGILCLNDDVVIHVAPPSKEPVPEQTEAFLVPKGTFVKMNIGVWHLAALPVHEKTAQVLIVLPERTYFTDCYVADYPEDDQIELVF